MDRNQKAFSIFFYVYITSISMLEHARRSQMTRHIRSYFEWNRVIDMMGDEE
jgi:hypothetical protein